MTIALSYFVTCIVSAFAFGAGLAVGQGLLNLALGRKEGSK